MRQVGDLEFCGNKSGGGGGGREKELYMYTCTYMYMYKHNGFYNSPDMISMASSKKKFLSGNFRECNLRSARNKFSHVAFHIIYTPDAGIVCSSTTCRKDHHNS